MVAAFACNSVCVAAVFGPPVHVPEVGRNGMAVTLDGNRLFVGAGSILYAFDVTEPLKPQLLGKLDGFDNLRQMRVRGNFVYVVSRETGMRIVDVSDPGRMRIRSLYDSVEFATGIEVAGDVAFISERTYGVEAVDVGNPDKPAHITLVKTHESQSCRYRDGYLYSGEWGAGAVTVFDARDMRRFRMVRELPLGGFGDGVDIDGNYLYCSTGHDALHRNIVEADAEGAGRGLDIFDISEPSAPKHVSRVDFPVFKPRNSDFWTPRVANGMAFCCDSHNGLFAVDVREPASPKLADRLCIPMQTGNRDWPSAAISSLEVGKGCLYMTCAPGGLYVVPVEGANTPSRPLGVLPANPSHRKRYATDGARFHVYRPAMPGQARAVALRGDIAYAAFGDAGLHVLRIKKEGGFEKIGELKGVRRVTDCCFSGDLLITAEGLDGFAAYRIENETMFREVARRKCAGGAGSVAFWCWAPDERHVLLSSRNCPYAFFETDRLDAAKPLAVLHGGPPQWSRFPADACVGGRYPVVVPSQGVIWMDLGGEKPVVAFRPASRMAEHPITQHDGIALLGDRYICVAGAGYRLYSAAGVASEWEPFGKGGHSGVPRTDGRLVAVSHRAARKVSVWDFSDAGKPVLQRGYRLSGNPDAAALYHGRALIPAGYQGLLMERSASSGFGGDTAQAVRTADAASRAGTVVASTFGWNAADSTAALQAAIDSGARRVVIDRQAGDWIVTPVFLRRSNQEVVVADGVTVRAKKGAFKARSACLFTIHNATNVLLRGEGTATLAMNKKDYQNPKDYVSSEWRHTVSIVGGSDITVRDLTLLSSGGDGVYVRSAAKRVRLDRLVCRDHHRQGISVISAIDLHVTGCRFDETGGTAPQCGVDVEPNTERDVLENIVFEDCTFDGNASSGMDLHLAALTEKTRPISVTFRRCIARGNRNYGITMYMVGRGGSAIGKKASSVRGTVVFDGCSVSGNGASALRIANQMADALKISFKDCVLDGRKGRGAPVWFNNGTLPGDFGNVHFCNVRVLADKTPAVAFDGIPGAGIKAGTMGGRLDVENADGSKTVVVMSGFAERHKPQPEKLKEILSFETSSVDFRSCAAASSAARLRKPVSTGKLRGRFTFVQYFPAAGEYPVVFRAVRLSPRRQASTTVQIRDAVGTDLGSFSLEAGSAVTNVIRATGPGMRRFEVDTGRGAASVESQWTGHGVLADIPVGCYKGRNRSFYFTVPADAGSVSVRVSPEGESCAALLLRPDGTVAAEKSYDGNLAVLHASRKPSAAPETWCVKFTKIQEDFKFCIGAPAIPFVSMDPDAAIRMK